MEPLDINIKSLNTIKFPQWWHIYRLQQINIVKSSMLRHNQPQFDLKPRKRVKLDTALTDEYDEFKGEAVEQIQQNQPSGTGNTLGVTNIENEISLYSRLYQDVKKNPRDFKKMKISQGEARGKNSEVKIEKPTLQVNKVKQQKPAENVKIEEPQAQSKAKKSKQKKPVEVSSNWKQFISQNKSIPKNTKESPKNPCNFVAIDCQFVKSGEQDCLARVSLVNEHGEQLYDSYVKPGRKITDFVTSISGITYSHIKNAPSQETVVAEIKKKMLNKIVVGHTTDKDLEVCGLKGWKGFKKVIDIADAEAYSPGGKRVALRRLALNHLGKTIQQGWHSSVQDANVTMQLFLKHKHDILKSKSIVKG